MMASPAGNPLKPALFTFLRELATNNERAWFEANKTRYERDVREPALALIGAMAPRLATISPRFRAVAKRSGGSLMRVYRDTRFSRDKTPYKTNVGIQFRHEVGRNVHAPGFYLHLAPGECFVGVGIWRPDGPALRRLRDFLADNPGAWRRAVEAPTFVADFVLAGESLTRAPRGYPVDHPLIEDLKRKDFIAAAQLTRKEVLAGDFADRLAAHYATAGAFMHYLCQALDLPYD